MYYALLKSVAHVKCYVGVKVHMHAIILCTFLHF